MKNIGVVCSENSIFCVERVDNRPGKCFVVTGQDQDYLRRQPGTSHISLTSEILTQFQQQFQKQSFKKNQINLALPTRDIIFRSFVIPWMQTNEIKNVVG